MYSTALKWTSAVSTGDKLVHKLSSLLQQIKRQIVAGYTLTLEKHVKKTFALGKDAIFKTVQKMLLKCTEER